MKKNLINDQDEIILYRSKKVGDLEFQEEKIDQDIYERISKRQILCAQLLCTSIFLFALAMAWLFGTLYFFEDREQEGIWLLGSILLSALAIIVLVISKVIKSREGKIKYKYKNEKYFYIGLIFLALSVFVLFGGLPVIGINANMFLFFILLGLGIAFEVYHDKTGGKKQKLNSVKEFIIVLLVCLLAGFLGLGFSTESNDETEFFERYSKSAMVIYDSEDIPNLIAKNDSDWYVFIKDDHYYELSVSNSPDELFIVYEIDDVTISSLQVNNHYAVWIEDSGDNLSYIYYDVEEMQVYEVDALPQSSDYPQNSYIGLYEDGIYYEMINYDNMTVNIVEYNITESTHNIIYTAEMASYEEALFSTLEVNDNNLIITNYSNGVPEIVHINLDKYMEDNYEPEVIGLNLNAQAIYKVFYKNGQYVIYYYTDNDNRIDIVNSEGNIDTKVYTFKQNEYAYNKIYLTDKELFWLESDYQGGNRSVDDYNLLVYNLESKNIQKVSKIFDFVYDDNKLYGLGYYKDNLENVRLYELYN